MGEMNCDQDFKARGGDVKKKTVLSNTIFIAVLAVALWTGLNSEKVVANIKRIKHGDSLLLKRVPVKLTRDQYFFSVKDSDAVFIKDLEMRDANIVVHVGSRSAEQQRNFLKGFCQDGKCQNAEERRLLVEGKDVYLFSFSNAYEGRNSFHHYLIVEGADIWAEYFGDKSLYLLHKPTLDLLLSEIVKKNNQAEQNAASPPYPISAN
jgi:hypothetical protein